MLGPSAGALVLAVIGMIYGCEFLWVYRRQFVSAVLGVLDFGSEAFHCYADRSASCVVCPRVDVGMAFLQVRHREFQTFEAAFHCAGCDSRLFRRRFLPTIHGVETARAGFVFRFRILVAAADAVAGRLPPFQEPRKEVTRFIRAFG